MHITFRSQFVGRNFFLLSNVWKGRLESLLFYHQMLVALVPHQVFLAVCGGRKDVIDLQDFAEIWLTGAFLDVDWFFVALGLDDGGSRNGDNNGSDDFLVFS